jgi:hypothetical protein
MRLSSTSRGTLFVLLALGASTGSCAPFHTRPGDPAIPHPAEHVSRAPVAGLGPQAGRSPDESAGEDKGLPQLPPPDATPTDAQGHEHEDETDPATVVPDDKSGLPIGSRYAALDRAACEAELGKRHIGFDRVNEARGVIAPLRLTSALSGVTFRSNLPVAQRKTSVNEIYDCRLVLALDDFAKILAKHDIVEVIHLSVYRPVSSKVTLKGPGRRHSGALAIDAAIFKTKDGKSLSVEKNFNGRIGAKPCPTTTNANDLNKIACEAAHARLFNVLLTPDYNWQHRNHFHLEVTAGVRWALVR